MLLSLTTGVWYGPETAALVVDTDGAALSLVPHQGLRAAVNVLGVGDAPTLRPYRGRNAAVVADGLGDVVATAHKRMRAGLSVLVSALSQDDVTGAVLEAQVEGTMTLKQALRLLLSRVAGDATGLDTNPSFKSMDGSKVRLAGTIIGGTRTITTRDGD